jgi:hypothetical protein
MAAAGLKPKYPDGAFHLDNVSLPPDLFFAWLMEIVATSSGDGMTHLPDRTGEPRSSA